MIHKRNVLLLGGLLLVGAARTSSAALVAFSPNNVDPGIGVVGFTVPQWYQDAIGLRVEYCPVGSTFCIAPDPVGQEGFWATADVIREPMAGGGTMTMIIALEAANLGAGLNFGRLRIDSDGLGALPGDYRLTHPYGVDVVNGFAGGPGRLVDRDIGCAPVPPANVCNFADALAADIGPFLYGDTGLPIGGPPDNFHIGQLGVPRTVYGSPLGTNFFRVERKPAGAPDTAYQIVAETNLFDVTGKVFTNGGALAATPPVLVNDVADPATGAFVMLAGSTKDFDVLANDQAANNAQVALGNSVAINPTSLGPFKIATAGAAGTATAVRVPNSNKVAMRFTPNPAFAGLATVNYNAATFTGALAPVPASAQILVEDLQVPTAEFLPKLMKWRIEGISRTGGAGVIPNAVDIHLGSTVDANGLPTGPLLGTAIVDPVTGRWAFEGKSTVSPGAADRTTISVKSRNNVARSGVACKVR